MKVTDLTDPGHEWQDLRKKIYHAVSKVNATQSMNAQSLKQMFTDASEGIEDLNGSLISKVTDLTDPGHEWQDLRKKVYHAVSKINAKESINAQSLKQMLQDAANSLNTPSNVEPPEYLGNGYIEWISDPMLAGETFIGFLHFEAGGNERFDMSGEFDSPPDYVTLGEWSGEDITYSYQWYTYDGENKVDIPGGTYATYYPITDHIGKNIGVKVTGTNDGGSTTVDFGVCSTAYLGVGIPNMDSEYIGDFFVSDPALNPSEVGLSITLTVDSENNKILNYVIDTTDETFVGLELYLTRVGDNSTSYPYYLYGLSGTLDLTSHLDGEYTVRCPQIKNTYNTKYFGGPSMLNLPNVIIGGG